MTIFVDDNFGTWDMEDEDDMDFYRQVQEQSVEKTCQGCGCTVRILPQYGFCNSCADRLERGFDLW